MNFQSTQYFVNLQQNNILRYQYQHRQWFRTGFGRNYNYNRRNQAFIVVSYNILAQSLIYKNPHLYAGHEPQLLDWSHRLNCITNEISALRPSILTLQEVQEKHLNEIETTLRMKSLHYPKPLYKKRTASDQDDGCAIFYDSTLFQLIDFHYVEYYQPNISVSLITLKKHLSN